MGGNGGQDVDHDRPDPDEEPVAQALEDLLAGDDSGLCAGLLDLLALLSDVGAARWLLHQAGHLALVAAPGGYGFRRSFAAEVIDAALAELAEAGLVTVDEAEFDDDDADDAADAGDAADADEAYDGDDAYDEDAGYPDDLDGGEELDDDGEDPDGGEELDDSAFDTVIVDPGAGKVILARHVAAGNSAEAGSRACTLLNLASQPGAGIDYALLADGMTACWDHLLPHLGAADDELVTDLLAMRVSGLAALFYYPDVSQEGAIEFGENLVADYEQALGPGHQDAWDARRNLAMVYGQCQRHDKAIEGLAGLCADMESALPSDDDEVLDMRAALAHAYMDAGRCSEAIGMLTELLWQCERLHEVEHASVLGTRCVLGLAHARAGDVGRGTWMIEAAIAAQEAAADHSLIRINVDYWRNVLAELRREAPAGGEAPASGRRTARPP